jgi:hypothetical protein
MVVACEYYDAHTKYIPGKYNKENWVVNRPEKQPFRRPIKNWQTDSKMGLKD